MTKPQLIKQIRQYNRTARADFLSWFDQNQLESYLQRLSQLHGCRGRHTVWVREGDTPAIVSMATSLSETVPQ